MDREASPRPRRLRLAAGGWRLAIDARMSSTRTSHAAGRKSIQTLSNVYLTIWCSAGSTQSVTSAVLFIFRLMSRSNLSSVSWSLDFFFPFISCGVFSSSSSLNRFVG
jgi:hypothetical protein